MIFLIWSQRHEAWWKPKGAGYTKRRVEAGRYSLEQLRKYRLDGSTEDVPQGADFLVVESREL